MSSPSRYQELKTQLSALTLELEAAYHEERQRALTLTIQLVKEFDLTAYELGLVPVQQLPAAPGRKPRTFRPKAPSAPTAPRYRDPATGQTWSGRGRPPAWLVGERDDYLLKANEAKRASHV